MKHAISHYGHHSNIALVTLVINPQCEMISLSLPPGTIEAVSVSHRSAVEDSVSCLKSPKLN